MSNKLEEDISCALIDLGLLEMQIRIFLATTSLDCPAVKDIARASETYRQEVYPALSELQSLGLVEKRIGIPNQYKAVSVSQALDILLMKKKSWIEEVQEKTKNLIEKGCGM